MNKLQKPDYSDFGELNQLIGSFDVHKGYAALVATAMQEISVMENKASHLWECGTYLELDEQGRLVKSNLCRERRCPLCQWRRSLRVYGQVQKMLQWLEPGGYKYLHLVLTIPNCRADDLKNQCDWLYTRSTAMFSDRLFGKRDQLGPIAHCKRSFKGIVRALEVTYNSDTDLYHPHLHCLIAVKSSYFTNPADYYSQEKLSVLWTGYAAPNFGMKHGDLFVLHVKRVKDSEKNNAVAEVAKYAVKPFHCDLDIDGYKKILPVLNRALSGRRMLQIYGVFADAARALKIDLNDDKEETEDSGALTRKFSFIHGKYREVAKHD